MAQEYQEKVWMVELALALALAMESEWVVESELERPLLREQEQVYVLEWLLRWEPASR